MERKFPEKLVRTFGCSKVAPFSEIMQIRNILFSAGWATITVSWMTATRIRKEINILL